MTGVGAPTIFSTDRRALRAARAARRQASKKAATFLLDEIAEEVAERLAFMRFLPERALVLGDPSGRLSDRLRELGGEVETRAIGSFDEEAPIEGGPFDLVASVLSLDTVNDLPGALIHLRGALTQGGLAVAALPAAGSLPALRAAMLAADGERPAARIHPLVDAGSGAALLQRAGFARQVADSFTVRASYESLARLTEDLRDQGLTSTLASTAPPLSKTALERARTTFAGLADSDGRTIETFEVLMLTGWKD